MTGEFSPVWAGGGGWSCHWRSYWGSGCSWTTWRGWLMLMMVVMIDNNSDCGVMAKFPTWWLNDDEDGDGVTIMENIFPRFILFKKIYFNPGLHFFSIQVYMAKSLTSQELSAALTPDLPSKPTAFHIMQVTHFLFFLGITCFKGVYFQVFIFSCLWLKVDLSVPELFETGEFVKMLLIWVWVGSFIPQLERLLDGRICPNEKEKDEEGAHLLLDSLKVIFVFTFKA